MTREELFRAVGEVREDQIEAAETVKKQVRPWRRFGALAACLALVVTVGVAAAELREADRWRAIVKSFDPSIKIDEDSDRWPVLVRPFNPGETDSGGVAAAGGMDGCEYWTDDPNHPLRPDYSINVEIGQLSEPGNGSVGVAASTASDAKWLSLEEIFAMDTLIFRGTVRELQYFQVELDGFGAAVYYTRALVEVTDSIRGGLAEGEVCPVLYMGAKGYAFTSVSGALTDLEEGMDAVFMPARTDRDTGWREGDSYFCYADLADLYISEGMRYVFVDTAEGLSFARDVYTELADAETLDEIAAYIRRMTAEEGTQPAAVPAEPQTEPSETADAAPSAPGPAGARVLPSGATIKGE